MTIYKHVLTVTVLATDASPDNMIAAIERASVPHALEVEATITADARRATPFMCAPNAPGRGDETNDAYLCRLDAWRDSLPRVPTFREDGRTEVPANSHTRRRGEEDEY